MGLYIGKLAKILGFSTQTIRNYEKIGLFKSRILENGYREFDTPDITLLMLIKKYHDYGFSMKEIIELLALPPEKRIPVFEKRELAIQTEIEELQRISRSLHAKKEGFINSCNLGKLMHEALPSLAVYYFRNNRELLASVFEDNQFAFLLAQKFPLYYVMLCPKEAFLKHEENHKIGLAISENDLHYMPSQKGFHIIPQQSCVTVTLPNAVERAGETWKPSTIIEDLERSGMYQYLESRNLVLSGDVLAVKQADIMFQQPNKNPLFGHYFKYYFPIEQQESLNPFNSFINSL